MFVDDDLHTNCIGDIINEQCDVFADITKITGNTSIKIKEILSILTCESLNQKVKEKYEGLSKINDNGLPFQWSLNLGADSPTIRFLCEAGKPGTSVWERALVSLKKVTLICDKLSFSHPNWLFDLVAPRILHTKIPENWLSAIWFAVGASNRAIIPKIYFNINYGSFLEKWRLIGWILKDLKRDLSLQSLCKISSIASKWSIPIGIAFDLMPNGNPGRIKIYFRSLKARMDFLERWLIACDADRYSAILRSFLDCFPIDNQYPDDAFIVSLEFHDEGVKNWRPTLKIDLAIAKWVEGDQQICSGVLRALGLLDISRDRYIQFLEKLGPDRLGKENIFHRFVGIGYETDGSIHTNIYFEPYLSKLTPKSLRTSSYPVSERRINDAINNALFFIIKSQKPDGKWVDFNLPIGESDVWVTAYVVYQMSFVHKEIQSQYSWNKSRTNASNWLYMIEQRNGWGYNSSADEDADSISFAILATLAAGRKVSRRCLDKLLSYFGDDGGASTYLTKSNEGTAWIMSHPDVTPVALLALENNLSQDHYIKALDFIQRQQNSDGLWSSYWWISPLYATFFSLLWLIKNNESIPRKDALLKSLRRFNPVGAFETALCVDCLRLLGENKFYGMLQNLLDLQQADGAWPSYPILRLTYPHVARPWMVLDSGPVYRDVRNIFATATVIGSLSRVTSE
jgi:hypothetical protein